MSAKITIRIIIISVVLLLPSKRRLVIYRYIISYMTGIYNIHTTDVPLRVYLQQRLADRIEERVV